MITPLTEEEKAKIISWRNKPIRTICNRFKYYRKAGDKISWNMVDEFLSTLKITKKKTGKKVIAKPIIILVKETEFKSNLGKPRDTGEFVDNHEWDLYYK